MNQTADGASGSGNRTSPGNVVFGRFTRRARMPADASIPRVVLLQGPVGPFFRRLQRRLGREGYDAWRICFNTADWAFSYRSNRVRYNGGLAAWSEWFRVFLTATRPQHLILFGCERPLHKVAIEIAREHGINVISLEEGYLRPGYVTVESGGNNRLSPIAGQLPEARTIDNPPPPVRYASFKRMGWYAAWYFILAKLASSGREVSTLHKTRNISTETFFWLRNAFRKVAQRSANFATVERLLEHHEHNYVVVPLQVSDDMQLGEAARGWSNERLIIETIDSFARHAPVGRQLVFKIHPLERGHTNDPRLIDSLARMKQISDRVHVVTDASLGLLVRHSAGVITINSSSGLSAITHGVPLLVIGDALYGIAELATCTQGEARFEEFWNGSFVAPADLRRRYIAWIKEQCLQPGDFYDAGGMAVASAAVLAAVQAAGTRPAASVAAVDTEVVAALDEWRETDPALRPVALVSSSPAADAGNLPSHVRDTVYQSVGRDVSIRGDRKSL